MNQKGFTLIELVVVIVILGILAAVAVPKFVDLSEGAEKATLTAVAGALGSASAINFATSKVDIDKATASTTCASVESLLEEELDSKYVIAGTDPTSSTVGECTVTTGSLTAAKFTAYYVSK